MDIPDHTKHYVVGFSGGKDSVATWLHLTRELELPHVTCTFSDTGHEWQGLGDYLTLLERDHGCRLVRIQPTLRDFEGELVPEKIGERLGLDPSAPGFWDEPLDMERLAILKRRFPSTMARFCTQHLKLHPQRRWLLANCDMGNTIRVSGVRAEESESRSKRPVWSFDKFMGCPLWLPIHAWTHDEVFATHRRHGVPPNPLYLSGSGRVGCFPCIMARKQELASLAERHPEAFENLTAMEHRAAAAVGKPVMTFFSQGKVPKRYASAKCPKTGKPVPTAEDVKQWALGELPVLSNQMPLEFEDDHTEDALSCTSQYGLCE